MEIPQKTLSDGRTLPCLGLGTWLMGGDSQRVENAQQDATDITAIRTAMDMGVTHIDTAESYGDGHAEEIVRKALQDISREKVFLATKATKGHHTKQLLTQALDSSLKRLGTDYLDLYYLHQPTLDTPFEETAEALNAAHQSGKIRNIGVCNFSIKNFDALQKHLKTKILVNQVHYNLVYREPEICYMFEHAEKSDYFIMAWRPLKLVRRSSPTSNVPHNIWERGVFPLLDEMADKYKASNVQIALSWVTHHPRAVTLVKSSNPTHLKELMETFRYKLSEDDYLRLTREFSPQFDKSDTVPLI